VAPPTLFRFAAHLVIAVAVALAIVHRVKIGDGASCHAHDGLVGTAIIEAPIKRSAAR